MREGLKSCREHVKDRALCPKIEDLHRNIVGSVRAPLDRVMDLLQPVVVVLNNLLGTVPVIFKDCAVRRQHQFDIEGLYFFLRVDEVLQGVIRSGVVNPNMRGDFGQQMVPDDQHFVRRKIEAAMSGRVSRRPHDDQFTFANTDTSAVVQKVVRVDRGV